MYSMSLGTVTFCGRLPSYNSFLHLGQSNALYCSSPCIIDAYGLGTTFCWGYIICCIIGLYIMGLTGGIMLVGFMLDIIC